MKNDGIILLLSFLFVFSVGTDAQISNWTLQQCIDTAWKNNLTIRQSSNLKNIATVDLDQSKANRLPSLNGSASETFGSGRTLNPVTYQFFNGNIWNNSFSLNGSVTLFNGFQNHYKIKQDRLNSESAKYDLENAKNDVAIAIVNSYLQLLYTHELVEASEKQANSTTSLVERTKQLVETGLKPESELLQLKAQLASDKLTLVKAMGQMRSAKVDLQQQMNVEFSPAFDILYNIQPQVPSFLLEGMNDIYATALSVQPIIKSYQLKTQSAAYSIRMAKSGAFPTLLLKGSIGSSYSSAAKYTDLLYSESIQPVGYLQSDPSEIVNGVVTSSTYNYRDYPFLNQIDDYKNYSLSLSLTIPIFNAFQVRNNMRKQALNYANTALDEQSVKNSLRKNIEQAYVDAENAASGLEAAKQQLEAASMSYENSKAKYESGIISVYDLLVDENKYFIAVSENLQAKYELIFRMKILDYYKGLPLN